MNTNLNFSERYDTLRHTQRKVFAINITAERYINLVINMTFEIYFSMEILFTRYLLAYILPIKGFTSISEQQLTN